MVAPEHPNGSKSTAEKPKRTGTNGSAPPESPPESPETVSPEMTETEELEFLRGERAAWEEERARLTEENANLRNSFQQMMQRAGESEASELKAWRRREEALELLGQYQTAAQQNAAADGQ